MLAAGNFSAEAWSRLPGDWREQHASRVEAGYWTVTLVGLSAKPRPTWFRRLALELIPVVILFASPWRTRRAMCSTRLQRSRWDGQGRLRHSRQTWRAVRTDIRVVMVMHNAPPKRDASQLQHYTLNMRSGCAQHGQKTI
jgi:hypothetical protein